MTQPTPKLASLFKLEYPQSVGIFNTYEEAQRAVDHLADARFPVENLAIVGTDLRSIERVLGRRSWATVIGQGLQNGLSTGLMVTFLMWLFMPDENFLFLLLSAIAIGIVIGIVFAVLGYWMSQGKRDFTSVSQTVATHYELLSEHKVAAQARELLAKLPGARAAQFDPRLVPPPGYPGYPQAPVGYPPVAPQGAYPPVAYPPAQPPAGYPGAGYPPPATPSGGFAPGEGQGLGYPPDTQAPPSVPKQNEPKQD